MLRTLLIADCCLFCFEDKPGAERAMGKLMLKLQQHSADAPQCNHGPRVAQSPSEPSWQKEPVTTAISRTVLLVIKMLLKAEVKSLAPLAKFMSSYKSVTVEQRRAHDSLMLTTLRSLEPYSH